VNLPASAKHTPPAYQAIAAEQIPVFDLKDGAGRARVIAGLLDGHKGPAKTFTPINVWDLDLEKDARVVVDAPDGHTTLIVVLSGKLVFDSTEVRDAEAALLSRSGRGARLNATKPTKVLVLTGAPIDEPIVGRGPFVMNTEAEVRQAFLDFGSGRFGAIARR
jgi:quercetin 2,3-dioxygenase